MTGLRTVVQQLRVARDAPTTPAYVELSLMGRCNFSCVQCHQTHHIRESEALTGTGATRLAGGRLPTLISELANLGVGTVELCGRGEPTLHPGLPDVITRIKAAGMRGFLVTNGSRLSATIREAVASSGFDRVTVSLYGGTDAHYQAVTGSPDVGILGRIVANLQALRREAPDTALYLLVLVQQGFAPHIADLHRVVSAVESASVHFAASLPYDGGELLQIGKRSSGGGLVREIEAVLDGSRCVDDPFWSSFRDWANGFLGSPGPNTIETTYAHSPCYAGKWAMFVGDDGMVRPCSNSNWVLGNVYEDSLAAIWNGVEYARFRTMAQSFMMRTGEPLPHSYCSHCGWARTQRRLHEAVVSDTLDGAELSWLEDPF